MGKLMLAFCVFWAYIGFSQYMLIWYANMPEETYYFIRRNIASWQPLSTFLVVGRFFIPFPLLLLQGTRRNRRYLCRRGRLDASSCRPSISTSSSCRCCTRRGVHPHILDLCALAAIGSVLSILFIKTLGRNSLFPSRDPRLAESLALTN